IVVVKTPLAFGITFAFSTIETVPSQRRSIFEPLSFDVPVTGSPVAPVAGYVMYEGSAGRVIFVCVGTAAAGAASTPSAAIASAGARGRILIGVVDTPWTGRTSAPRRHSEQIPYGETASLRDASCCTAWNPSSPRSMLNSLT